MPMKKPPNPPLKASIQSSSKTDHVALLSQLISPKEDIMSSPKLRLVKPDPTPQEIVRSLNDSEKTEVKMGKLFASWAKSQAIYMQEKNSGFSGMETSGKQIKPST
jgi:hypothetical protein